MREIKFRAWDEGVAGQSPRYFTWEQLFKLSVSLRTVFDNGGLLLEQYTGLIDNNGREIYEGDIISIRDTYEIGSGTAIPEPYIIVVDWSYSQSIGYDDCLIIGNIHENPELLK